MTLSKIITVIRMLGYVLGFQAMLLSFYHHAFLGWFLNGLWAVFFLFKLTKGLVHVRQVYTAGA